MIQKRIVNRRVKKAVVMKKCEVLRSESAKPLQSGHTLCFSQTNGAISAKSQVLMLSLHMASATKKRGKTSCSNVIAILHMGLVFSPV